MRNERSRRLGCFQTRIQDLALIGVSLVVFCLFFWTADVLISGETGLDFWSMGQLKNQSALERNQYSSMDQRIETGINRMALREQILINLRDEKITLEEAGRGFLAINQTDEAILCHLDTFFSGETDLERSTRQVVAQMRCSIQPGSHECYLRLKSELETIQFPKTSNGGEIQIASRRGG